MKYSELVSELKFHEGENDFYIPNEIFKNIINMLNEYHNEQNNKASNDGKKKKGSPSNHIAFTYSYYYLISWLYRNAKYQDHSFTKEKINEILGFAPKYRDCNYIVKAKGLLDQYNFTVTTTEYPVLWELDDDNTLQFTTISEFINEYGRYDNHNSKNFKVKLPVKAFTRHIEDEEMKKFYDEEGYEDGFFYEIENTHHVQFEVFLFCMSKEELGCTAFYLWCYLKMMNQKFQKGYDIPLTSFELETGIKKRTVVQYLGALRSYNMVKVIHNQEAFCLSIKASERMANTYITNPVEDFSDTSIDYEKLPVLTKQEYKSNQWNKKVEKKVTIPFDELPY